MVGQHRSVVSQDVVAAGRGRSSAVDDPPIRVRVDRDLVVIQPSGPADRDTTAALSDALNAAVAAGAVALLDVDVDLDPEPDGAGSLLRLPAEPDPAPPGATAPWPAEAVEAGGIRLVTTSGWWTIDWPRRRLCRAHHDGGRATDGEDWIGVRRVWVSRTHVIALTSAGSYRSARR